MIVVVVVVGVVVVVVDEGMDWGPGSLRDLPPSRGRRDATRRDPRAHFPLLPALVCTPSSLHPPASSHPSAMSLPSPSPFPSSSLSSPPHPSTTRATPLFPY